MIATQAGIGVDIQITGRSIERPVLIDHQIDACLSGRTPGTVQCQVAKALNVFIEEAGIVDASTDIQLYP